jgi:hypothetical protein
MTRPRAERRRQAKAAVSPSIDANQPSPATDRAVMILTYRTPYAIVVRAHVRSIVRQPKHTLAFLFCIGLAFATGTIIAKSALVGLAGAVGIGALDILCPQLLFNEEAERLAFHPGGIRASIGQWQRFYAWRHVAGIERDRLAMTIYLANLKAFVIPLSAFANPNEIDATVAALNALRRGVSAVTA